MKIPNRILQSLLNFCLSTDQLDLVKERMESTRDQELAIIKNIESISFYRPLTQPCYYQYEDVSKILASDGNRVFCYELKKLNVCIVKEPIFISLNKKDLTEKWMTSVGNNQEDLELDSIILTGEILLKGNIFEILVNSQIGDIQKLLEEDSCVEINAQYLLDAVSAAIATSTKEVPTIKMSTDGGKTLLFEGERLIGVIMGFV